MLRMLIARFLIVALVTIVALLAFAGLFTFSKRSPHVADAPSAASSAEIVLAECLSSNGYVLYSAWWCSYCKKQRDAFGPEAYAKLTVVECSPEGEQTMKEECRARGVTGFPTWSRPDGMLEGGFFPLEALSQYTGCPYAPSVQK